MRCGVMVCRLWSGLAALWLLSAPAASAAAARVLVDASKDGGLWWYPQGAGQRFDPAQPHQGKDVADLLESRGYIVDELPRGATLQPALLNGVDVLVRPVPFAAYTQAEAQALGMAVAAGMRLVAMPRTDTSPDLPLAAFGIQTGQELRMGCITRAADHAVTRSLLPVQGPWRTLRGEPPAWVPLARLGGASGTPLTVAGYLRHGKGDIVVVGCGLHLFDHGKALADLVDALMAQSPERLAAALTPTPTLATMPVPAPPVPIPAGPAAGAQVPQPDAAGNASVLTWQPVPGAARYQLAATGPSASLAVMGELLPPEPCSCPVAALRVRPQGLSGWVWQVRAQDAAGQWSDWSEPHAFSVVPTTPRPAGPQTTPSVAPERPVGPAAAARAAAEKPAARATAMLRLGVTLAGLVLLVILGLILIKGVSRS